MISLPILTKQHEQLLKNSHSPAMSWLRARFTNASKKCWEPSSWSSWPRFKTCLGFFSIIRITDTIFCMMCWYPIQRSKILAIKLLLHLRLDDWWNICPCPWDINLAFCYLFWYKKHPCSSYVARTLYVWKKVILWCYSKRSRRWIDLWALVTVLS